MSSKGTTVGCALLIATAVGAQSSPAKSHAPDDLRFKLSELVLSLPNRPKLKSAVYESEAALEVADEKGTVAASRYDEALRDATLAVRSNDSDAVIYIQAASADLNGSNDYLPGDPDFADHSASYRYFARPYIGAPEFGTVKIVHAA